MSGLDHWYEQLAAGFMFLTVIAFLAHSFFTRGHHTVMQTIEVGEIAGFIVEALRDGRGKRLVGVSLYVTEDIHAQVSISPSDARRLAAMLRLAVSPGRNLVQARWNSRKATR